ncbi:MAG: hypothetical protein AAFV96_00535 [Pseudomonadota bacterium]
MIRARRGSILIDALVGFAVIAAAVLGFHALGRQSLTAKEAAEIGEAVAEIALAEQAELAVRGAPLGRTERVIDRPPLPRLRLIREIVPGTPMPLRLVTQTRPPECQRHQAQWRRSAGHDLAD